ncbi:winged helix-turn-helix transcriptional regulator [Elusimicrobiota bacterium]
MSEISTKELKVIESISRNSTISQRGIARDIGVSLGMTNILIGRLVKKGYLKARKLNARKVSYIITPQGLKERTRKTYRFMKRSFSVIGRLSDNITEFAMKKYSEGKKDFIIVGKGELSDLTELVLNSLKKKDINVIKMADKDSLKHNGAVIFNTVHSYTGQNGGNELNIWIEAEKLYGSNYEL